MSVALALAGQGANVPRREQLVQGPRLFFSFGRSHFILRRLPVVTLDEIQHWRGLVVSHSAQATGPLGFFARVASGL